MLAMFGISLFIGVILVIASLWMTRRENPTGCIVFFGLIIFFILSALMTISAQS